MADLRKKLSEDKITEIESFLQSRFSQLEKLRSALDTDIKEEVDLYNNIDVRLNAKPANKEKLKIPYLYTIVQTIVARLFQSFFADQNYVKVYAETKDMFDSAEDIKDFQRWVQSELDKMKIKQRARDYLEDACVQRTNWIELKPSKEGSKFKIDFGVYSFYDVYFDTKAVRVEDSDFFIKKIQKLYNILMNQEVYFNIEKITKADPPDYIQEKQKYESEHGQSYYDPEKNNVTDEVELMEWHGKYDLNNDLENPDFQDVIFTIVNRKFLVRAETVELKTNRKILLFPIIPLKQPKSLIGKGIPQLLKDIQYSLNETSSLRIQNLKLQTGLLFKYKKGGSVALGEVSASGGNAIGWEDDPNDISTFDIPNLLQETSAMISENIQIMQQTVGAVDYLMGTSAGRGITETASGINTITDQAVFKITMLAHNIYDTLLEMINYVILLHVKYNSKEVLLKYPRFKKFFEQSEDILEDSLAIDIGMRDLSQRRDVERSQFINAASIILPILMKTNGNVSEFLKRLLDALEFDNPDSIVNPPPMLQQTLTQIQNLMASNPIFAQLITSVVQNPAILQQLAPALLGQQAQTAAGGGLSSSPSQATPEETANNMNPSSI